MTRDEAVLVAAGMEARGAVQFLRRQRSGEAAESRFGEPQRGAQDVDFTGPEPKLVRKRWPLSRRRDGQWWHERHGSGHYNEPRIKVGAVCPAQPVIVQPKWV